MFPTPKPPHDYGDGWTGCRITYRCRCGIRGELILCRTDEFPAAVAEARAGKMLCGSCEKQAVKTQPNPVVRLAKLANVTNAELYQAVHATASGGELAGHVRWVVEELAET